MKKTVRVNHIPCGSDELFLISGPCVIEDETIMYKTAEHLEKVARKLKINLIFKSSFMKDNRSSVDNYMGPGIDEGLKMLERIKNDFGFPGNCIKYSVGPEFKIFAQQALLHCYIIYTGRHVIHAIRGWGNQNGIPCRFTKNANQQIDRFIASYTDKYLFNIHITIL